MTLSAGVFTSIAWKSATVDPFRDMLWPEWDTKGRMYNGEKARAQRMASNVVRSAEQTEPRTAVV